MITEAVSIVPQDGLELLEVDRILRFGRAKLVGPTGDQIVLPDSLNDLLREIVQRLSQGHSLVLMPEEKQLTTQEVGRLLGMSRPYVIRLLNAGEMPYSLVGKHRRVALRDVVAYSTRRANARKSALNQMARDAYTAGLYDNETLADNGPVG